MAVPLVIAQITDLHIKPPGEFAYRKVDTALALTRLIGQLKNLRPRPAVIVATGDLVDAASEAAYAHLDRLLAPLDLPLAAIPGNHDDRDRVRRMFPGQRYAQLSGATNLHLAVEALDLFLLDSSVPGQPHGHLDRATLSWLDASLASSTHRPALVFLHHPPFATGITHMDRQNLQNARDLAALVARHPRVRLIAAGHVHRAVATIFAGVAATICPAPNHAVDLDLLEARGPAFRSEPPAFHLHAWFAGGRFGHLVTHLVPIGRFGGPHPFFDAHGQPL
jgi:3',5'-cyclic-AMP phosphodiesterase